MSSKAWMGLMPGVDVADTYPWIMWTPALFQLVSRRYTKGSIIITSNQSYAEWGSVFGD